MAQHHIRLEHTEGIISQMATQLYAAYIVAGKVTEKTEKEWMSRSIREAIQIARTVDESIVGENEMG